MNRLLTPLASASLPPARTSRGGVSLLEIMISIGVVGIGLLGVAALIPLAHYKAAEGVREERKALFGRRAYREFFIHGFNQPGRWQASTQALPVPIQRPNWIAFAPMPSPPLIYNVQGDGRLIPRTYCFDPHLFSYRLGSGLPQTHVVFPENATNLPVPQPLIPRITVLSPPPNRLRESLLARQNPPTVAWNQFTNQVTTLNLLQRSAADEIFRIRDDLPVNQPTEPNQTTTFSYFTETTGPTKKLASGNFSWMATLVPELMLHPLTAAAGVPPYNANRYVLSIVVYRDRELSGQYREEAVANVMFGGASFLSGSTKELRVVDLVPPDPAVPQNAGVKDIQVGHWVALTQPAATGNSAVLRWYEVVAADTPENELTNQRELTLSGPDWALPTPDLGGPPVFLVYLRNVETVYEKTIELDLD